MAEDCSTVFETVVLTSDIISSSTLFQVTTLQPGITSTSLRPVATVTCSSTSVPTSTSTSFFDSLLDTLLNGRSNESIEKRQEGCVPSTQFENVVFTIPVCLYFTHY